MDPLAVIAMNLGLLAQNYAEWRAGGPLPPAIIGAKDITPSTRAGALILVSVLVAGASAIAVILGAGWLIATLAAALIANALFQAAVSVRAGSLQPGTVSGLVFMLPASVWAFVSADNPLGWTAFLIGPVGSVPLLLFIWWVSGRLTRSRSF